jgi:DNA-binding winged helix-turn-helix (wHTH) protein
VTAGCVTRFGRYRLHPTQGLTRGTHDVRVTPKALAVLCTLAERPGEVVTKDELFRAVWPDTAVSDGALTTCIQELRLALGDDARRPRYIETLHRRGFRFIAATSIEPVAAFDPSAPEWSPVSRAAPGPMVGRDTALSALSDALARAHLGERQLIFVTGEPGIGKTVLVDHFVAARSESVCRADSVEHHGAGEAFQPLLEALTRLCHRSGGEAYLSIVRQCAPSWLAQLPALQTDAERNMLRRRPAGTTAERMLRELTDALEVMGRRNTLVLCLEDLHWADASTLDWIASFSRRPDPARVLIVGTYRPGGVGPGRRSPDALAAELLQKNRCTELGLERLDLRAVSEYVSACFPPAEGSADALSRLAEVVHHRTEGHPLFIVNVMAALIEQGVLRGEGGKWDARGDLSASGLAIPEGVRRTIDLQIDRMEEVDRLLLETASLVGASATAAAVAAGAGVAVTEVEARLAAAARRKLFLRQGASVEWPDGTLSASFEFLHALYREVLGERVLPARRVDVHRVVGHRLESAYGQRSGEVAAELALHFEEGREFERAIAYLQLAAETDRRRSAHAVAQDHYLRALALIERLPASADRDEHEVALRIGLGHVLMQTRGWGAPEVQAAFARVRELSETRGGASRHSALWNLWIYSTTCGKLGESRELADRLLAEAVQSGDPETLLQAHHAQWSTRFTVGDFSGAEMHAREGLRLSEAGRDATLAYGSHDTGVCARSFLARVLAISGRTDAAVSLVDDTVTRARGLDHPFTLAFALVHAASVHETLGEAAATRAYAAEAREVAREHAFDLMRAWATCLLGWSLVELNEVGEGLSLLVEGTAAAQATGSALFQPQMLGLLSRGQTAAGRPADASGTVEHALAIGSGTGERFYAAELHRLRGEARLAAGPLLDADRLADDDFRSAAGIAEGQGAWLFAMRSALRLARPRSDGTPNAEGERLVGRIRARLPARSDTG